MCIKYLGKTVVTCPTFEKYSQVLDLSALHTDNSQGAACRRRQRWCWGPPRSHWMKQSDNWTIWLQISRMGTKLKEASF